jgi:protein-tyrosine phosphatase
MQHDTDSSTPKKMRILMVCMGNICRSPTAEAVLRQRIDQLGLRDVIEVDSAGTQAYHVGKTPDDRSIAHGARRGYDLMPLRARQVADLDFEHFDLILAMDNDNLADLKERCPEPLQSRICKLMDFAPEDVSQRVVPDPYYGGEAGFERVLDLIEKACDGLLEALQGSRPGPPEAS